MERKILAAKNDNSKTDNLKKDNSNNKETQNNDSKNNHRKETNHKSADIQYCDAKITQKCDAQDSIDDGKMNCNSITQVSCDEPVTHSDANKVTKCDEEVPTGILRRCSTKRYALVRQSKVIGEKQRQKIEEK